MGIKSFKDMEVMAPDILDSSMLMKEFKFSEMSKENLICYASLEEGTFENFSMDRDNFFLKNEETVYQLEFQIVDYSDDIEYEGEDEIEMDNGDKYNTFYTFFSEEEDLIVLDYIYTSVKNTKLCFGDLGKKELSKGGFFIQMILLNQKEC